VAVRPKGSSPKMTASKKERVWGVPTGTRVTSRSHGIQGASVHGVEGEEEEGGEGGVSEMQPDAGGQAVLAVLLDTHLPDHLRHHLGLQLRLRLVHRCASLRHVLLGGGSDVVFGHRDVKAVGDEDVLRDGAAVIPVVNLVGVTCRVLGPPSVLIGAVEAIVHPRHDASHGVAP